MLKIEKGFPLGKKAVLKKEEDSAAIREIKWQNSVAVLPFVDLSPQKDQEYFCEGVTGQIITNLSKLRVVKVIARTSVAPYKDTKKKIPEMLQGRS